MSSYSLCWIYLCILGCSAQPAPPGGCTGDVYQRILRSFHSDISPVLDGVLSSDEWADATNFTSLNNKKQNKWLCEFAGVPEKCDLSLSMGYVKHTDKHLYFGFDITDDLNYWANTTRWLPAGNPNANSLDGCGWPFFGDEMEILIDAGGVSTSQTNVAGNESQWQLVANSGKSLLGGLGKGGLMPGDRPAVAYTRYADWIKQGLVQAVTKLHSNGYTAEWMISYQLLHLSPGVPYNSNMPDTLLGLNIALGDVDTQADGHPYYGMKHEQWWSGEKVNRTQINEFGTLYLMEQKTASQPKQTRTVDGEVLHLSSE